MTNSLLIFINKLTVDISKENLEMVYHYIDKTLKKII